MEGSYNLVIGDGSHAEGINNYVSSEECHAEGIGCTAAAQVLMWKVITTYAKEIIHTQKVTVVRLLILLLMLKVSSTMQEGNFHAEGVGCTAFGTGAHVEGYYNISEGNYSHAEGTGTIAYGTASHAEGDTNKPYGYASHAEGYLAVANGDWSHAEGNILQPTATILIRKVTSPMLKEIGLMQKVS